MKYEKDSFFGHSGCIDKEGQLDFVSTYCIFDRSVIKDCTPTAANMHIVEEHRKSF